MRDHQIATPECKQQGASRPAAYPSCSSKTNKVQPKSRSRLCQLSGSRTASLRLANTVPKLVGLFRD
jgi:hypothetical protein